MMTISDSVMKSSDIGLDNLIFDNQKNAHHLVGIYYLHINLSSLNMLR